VVVAGCGGGGGGGGEAATQSTVPTTRPILTTTLATTTVPELGGTAYAVQSGDTLGRIAADHGVSLERLLTFNGISADAVLQPGYKLLIPPSEDTSATTGGDGTGGDTGPELPLGAQTYVIAAGDTFNAIAARFDITLDQLLSANDLTVDSVLHPGDEIIIPASQPTTTTAAGATATSSGGSTTSRP
jgi:peptidoglycan DL-endopeptidase LytF